MELSSLSFSQRQRLAFIDFCLQYFGQIARGDLIQHFSTGLASGSRDFTLYKELAPNNLQLRHQTKLYYRTEPFTPLFNHDPEEALSRLCNGFGDGFTAPKRPSDICFDAIRLIHPKAEIVATLMRAIGQQQVISCEYVSLSSGISQRELVPHSLVNSGHRWHVRAFDRKSSSFRDFVCTRFIRAAIAGNATENAELREADLSWQNILSLTLTPHPKLMNPLAIELDYNMTDSKLTIQTRAAIAGYLLQEWNVDCSHSSQLNEKQYPLRLENTEVLQQIENSLLAPGFTLSTVKGPSA
ncbi:WYL domain-containing protein [Thalassomonas viridans]|uniref:WYL domain-containing protein n=1 Tax=Thalassomonas viridans TaxID=137584 RepID=A0AAE9Z1Z7_9GAMM|nr:WYL domain-containing protein [Thalassomonas viridans]WDE04549.1 WYL domain-containing protein [Thalassomonas viridans]